MSEKLKELQALLKQKQEEMNAPIPSDLNPDYKN